MCNYAGEGFALDAFVQYIASVGNNVTISVTRAKGRFGKIKAIKTKKK